MDKKKPSLSNCTRPPFSNTPSSKGPEKNKPLGGGGGGGGGLDRENTVCRVCNPSMFKHHAISASQVTNMMSDCFAGNVEVVNGQVTICVDALKGTCNRSLCKYYHKPSETKNTEKDNTNQQGQLPLV